jgi:hypothetical protein
MNPAAGQQSAKFRSKRSFSAASEESTFVALVPLLDGAFRASVQATRTTNWKS